jgi:AcrR family transcriptional regulator
MVSERSGAAIGSIQNFYKSKERLAAAVYDDIAAGMVADCAAALNGQGRDVQAAIHALLQACQAWPERYPNYHRLSGLLKANMSMATFTEVGELQQRLEQVLAAWAEPRIKTGFVRPMSGAQLFAVMLAPVMAVRGGGQIHEGENSAVWHETLLQVAANVIVPRDSNLKPNSGRGRPNTRARSSGSKESSLDQTSLF